MSIFFIAEIGINHNGDMDIAKALIDLAKSCDCDAVKFQKRDIDSVYTQEFLAAPRESPWGGTQRDQKVGLEFGLEQYREIDRYCREAGIVWFASAWDRKSLDFLKQFDLGYHKVASAMMADEVLLRDIAAQGRYTFISTGMCDVALIDRAVGVFKDAGCPFELMHCVSTYPMKDEDANLRRIVTLRERYGCKVGYSGHESGLAISYAAAALGATSIERHITLDRAMYGSDQAASLEPAGLRQLVGAVRKIANSLGDGAINITEKEKPIAAKLRAHIPGFQDTME